MNYYNEFDPFAAQWLRNLIAAGLIPDGHIDERSIKEVEANDLKGFTQCHFFAGIAGWPLALQIAGWPTTEPVWTGSCPCQPFSTAGKCKGTADERHLWPDFHRLIAECRPAIVFGEQVASKAGREWLAGVRADLEALGYAVGAADLCSAGKESPTLRQRLWWMGESDDAGSQPRRQAGKAVGYRSPTISTSGNHSRMVSTWCNGRDEGTEETSRPQSNISGPGPWDSFAIAHFEDGSRRRFECGSFPLAYGIPVSLGRGRTGSQRMAIRAARANRVGRLKGYGNAINPWVAAEFVMAFLES